MALSALGVSQQHGSASVPIECALQGLCALSARVGMRHTALMQHAAAGRCQSNWATCMMTCSGACAAGNWPGSWKWRTMPGACGGAGRCSAERSDMGALAGHKRDGAVCTPGSVFRYLLRSGMCWTAAASAGPEPAPQVHVGHAAGRTALPAVPVPARGQVLGPRAPLRPTSSRRCRQTTGSRSAVRALPRPACHCLAAAARCAAHASRARMLGAATVAN